MGSSIGALAKLAMAPSGTASEPYDFVSEDLALHEEFVDLSGFRGTRGHPSERVRASRRFVSGMIVFHPTPVDLDLLLPRILGAAESTDVFNVAEALPSFIVTVDRNAKVPTYSGNYVNRATFSGSEGQPLQLALDILGADESVGTSFPALTISDATVPYMFYELVLVVGGVTYSTKNWQLEIDNGLETQFFNSVTPTRMNATDRIVTVTVQLPYGDATAAYGLSSGGVAVTATFTNGGVSCAFSTPKVAFPRNSPTVRNDRGELFLNLTGIARKSGATAELAITSDSSP